MKYRTKCFNFLADLVAASPMAADNVLEHVAGVMGCKLATLKAEIKTIQKKRAAKDADGPDPEEVCHDLFFDGSHYWRREQSGNFCCIGREDMGIELRRKGLSSKKSPGADLSPVEHALYHIQTHARVDYTAPFCGRMPGRYVENGLSILATTAPTHLAAKAGNAGPARDFFAGLFGREAGDPHWAEQMRRFMAWLQRARSALRNPHQHLPGQLLAFVGPADCGKTLAQSLITEMLGGRGADPSSWLTGASQFNDTIWGAEHWAASDSNIADTAAARKTLRDRVKEATANESLSCHRKYLGEITLRPIARLTFSANDDADSTFVLPPLDESIRDKVIYLKCHPPGTPFPTDTEEARDGFRKGLSAALPAFLYEVENYEMPADMRKGRFGVGEWHHPAIVELLAGTNRDADLAGYLTEWLAGRKSDFTGPAVKLYEALDAFHGAGGMSYGFSRLCRDATLLGQALARLSRVEGWKGRITGETVRLGPNKQKQTHWTVRYAS